LQVETDIVFYVRLIDKLTHASNELT